MAQLEDNQSFDNDDDSKSMNSNQSAQSAPSKHSKVKKNGPAQHLAVIDHDKPLPSSGDELALTDDASVNSYNSDTSRKQKRKKLPSADGAYQKLAKQERREFRLAFRLFDKDDDGQISVLELKEVFEGLNYHFTTDQLISMLKGIDDNSDGKVDIDEFVHCMKGDAFSDISNMRPYVEELKEAFEIFDKDGDGQITPQELSATMIALGEKLTDQDILSMINEADADGDGNIDFDGLYIFLYICARI